MKAIAHRTRDLADIEAIVETHKKLNKQRIRRIVKQFADILEAPEILNDLEKII